MDFCTKNYISAYQLCQHEARGIIHHGTNRFKDITPLAAAAIGSYPKTLGSAAFILGWYARPLFAQARNHPILALSAIASSMTVLGSLDYLNNTYFCRALDPSMSLWQLFQRRQGSEIHRGIMDTVGPIAQEMYEDLEKEEPRNEDLIDLFKCHDKDLIEQQEARKNDKRPVLVFLTAKSDHNQALQLNNKDNAITINGDNSKGAKELDEKYRIRLITGVATIDEAKEKIEDITDNIQQMWILAHGSPTKMDLSNDCQIDSHNVDPLLDLLREKLEPDADVVLYCCSRAQNIASGDNIATKFSKGLPGRTVWAQKKTTGIVSLDLGKDFSVKVAFLLQKSRLRFLIEKIWNICTFHRSKKVELEWNVTAQIKDGLEVIE